jgi:hypothetical protein
MELLRRMRAISLSLLYTPCYIGGVVGEDKGVEEALAPP